MSSYEKPRNESAELTEFMDGLEAGSSLKGYNLILLLIFELMKRAKAHGYPASKVLKSVRFVAHHVYDEEEME